MLSGDMVEGAEGETLRGWEGKGKGLREGKKRRLTRLKEMCVWGGVVKGSTETNMNKQHWRKHKQRSETRSTTTKQRRRRRRTRKKKD